MVSADAARRPSRTATALAEGGREEGELVRLVNWILDVLVSLHGVHSPQDDETPS